MTAAHTTNIAVRNTVTAILAQRQAALDAAKTAAASSPVQSAVNAATATAPTQLPEAVVAAFLEEHLPGLIDAAIAIVTPPFRWSELSSLVQIIAQVAVEGLPQAPGLELTATVSALVSVLFRLYVAPRLPAWAKPFSGLIQGALVRGVQAAIEYAQTARKR